MSKKRLFSLTAKMQNDVELVVAMNAFNFGLFFLAMFFFFNYEVTVIII